MAGINPATAYNKYLGNHPTKAFYLKPHIAVEPVQRDVTTNVPQHVGKGIPAKSIHGTAVADSTNMDERLTWLHHRTEQQQYEMDVAMWYGVTTSNQNNAQKRRMVKRIFQVLYYGGLMFRRGTTWSPWHATTMPVAAALSHGGRVMVQLPPGTSANQFWLWLWAGIDPEANHRSAATHGASYISMPNRIYNKLSFWNEDKLSAISPRAHSSKHYGVNIGVGGDGNLNPFSGMQIDDSGAHGHLYIYYRNETDKNSLCMLSCEDSAPMDRYQGSWNGLVHGQYAVGQTGHAHKFGGAGAFTATGGKTWDQAGWTTTGPDTKYNCMFIDLSKPVLVNAIMATQFSNACLSDPGDALIANEAILPSLEQWKAMSSVTFSSRDTALQQIDTALTAYLNIRNAQNRQNLRLACMHYNGTNATRKAAVQILALLVEQS